jgi:formylglycine-generating enzyme required for sulfatase activity
MTGSSLPPSAPPKPTHPTFEFKVVTVNAQGQITDKTTKTAEYHPVDLGNGISLELVKIPSGQFLMGAPDDEPGRSEDEGPQHRVTVPEFWMGKYPVTQAQYEAIMGNNPSRFTKDGASRPVEKVSWHDAVQFCEKLSEQTGTTFRLPSEAEWEYACRAGTTTPFHFGPTITIDLANYHGSVAYGSGPTGVYRQETTPVGSFGVANAFGLYDMHGNVWEWCQDVWHDNYEGAPTDGSACVEGGNKSFRLLRGGSWCPNPRYCRSANRYLNYPDCRGNSNGFRVVCSAARAL